MSERRLSWMDLNLHRDTVSSNGILGTLSINGVFECYTLERDYDDPIAKPIPPGYYRVHPYDSPRFKRKVLLLEDVPGRSGIEIHMGNFETHTKGCILVGKSRSDGYVWISTMALEDLLEKVTASPTPCFLRVVNSRAVTTV